MNIPSLEVSNVNGGIPRQIDRERTRLPFNVEKGVEI